MKGILQTTKKIMIKISIMGLFSDSPREIYVNLIYHLFVILFSVNVLNSWIAGIIFSILPEVIILISIVLSFLAKQTEPFYNIKSIVVIILVTYVGIWYGFGWKYYNIANKEQNVYDDISNEGKNAFLFNDDVKVTSQIKIFKEITHSNLNEEILNLILNKSYNKAPSPITCFLLDEESDLSYLNSKRYCFYWDTIGIDWAKWYASKLDEECESLRDHKISDEPDKNYNYVIPPSQRKYILDGGEINNCNYLIQEKIKADDIGVFHNHQEHPRPPEDIYPIKLVFYYYCATVTRDASMEMHKVKDINELMMDEDHSKTIDAQNTIQFQIFIKSKDLEKLQDIEKEREITLADLLQYSLIELNNDSDDITILKEVADGDYKFPLIDFLYFSAVTITTTGFGDILPNSTEVRALVMIESLLGVILPGMFVSALFLSIQGNKKSRSIKIKGHKIQR